MKHLLILLTAAGIFSFAVCSNVSAQEKFDWGARIGANISDYSVSKTSESATFSSQVGILGGLQFDYWFTQKWAFCAQLLFLQKGGKALVTQSGQTTTLNESNKTNYLEIPLEAKLQFGEDGTVRPYIFLGPTIGFLLSATGTALINGQPTEGADIKSHFASTDFGIIGGAGLSFLLSDDLSLFLEAGYAYGFANVYQDSQPTAANTRDIRISAGILFR